MQKVRDERLSATRAQPEQRQRDERTAKQQRAAARRDRGRNGGPHIDHSWVAHVRRIARIRVGWRPTVPSSRWIQELRAVRPPITVRVQAGERGPPEHVPRGSGHTQEPRLHLLPERVSRAASVWVDVAVATTIEVRNSAIRDLIRPKWARPRVTRQTKDQRAERQRGLSRQRDQFPNSHRSSLSSVVSAPPSDGKQVRQTRDEGVRRLRNI